MPVAWVGEEANCYTKFTKSDFYSKKVVLKEYSETKQLICCSMNLKSKIKKDVFILI